MKQPKGYKKHMIQNFFLSTLLMSNLYAVPGDDGAAAAEEPLSLTTLKRKQIIPESKASRQRLFQNAMALQKEIDRYDTGRAHDFDTKPAPYDLTQKKKVEKLARIQHLLPKTLDNVGGERASATLFWGTKPLERIRYAMTKHPKMPLKRIMTLALGPQKIAIHDRGEIVYMDIVHPLVESILNEHGADFAHTKKLVELDEIHAFLEIIKALKGVDRATSLIIAKKISDGTPLEKAYENALRPLRGGGVDVRAKVVDLLLMMAIPLHQAIESEMMDEYKKQHPQLTQEQQEGVRKKLQTKIKQYLQKQMTYAEKVIKPGMAYYLKKGA